jgi:Flp pilus assembly protein TadG
MRENLSSRSLRILSDNKGVAAIEFGVLMPVLVLMAVAAIDLGMGFYRKMQVEYAAQAGAQWAVRNGFDLNGITGAETAATSSSVATTPAPVQFCGCPTGSGISTTSCGVSCSGGVRAGTYTTVSAQMTYNTIINYGLFPSSYNLTSQSTVRLQ